MNKVLKPLVKVAGGVAGGLIGGPVGAAIGFGATGAAASALKKKKKTAAAPVPLPQITPRRPSAASEAIAGRMGSAINRRTGDQGVESSTRGTNRLLGRN